MTHPIVLGVLGIVLLACESPSEFVPSADDGGGATGSGGVSGGGSGGGAGIGGAPGGGGVSGSGAVPAGGGGNDSGGACASPKTECTQGTHTVCTDTSSDDANCGACNSACPTDAVCKSSNCACNATKTFCKQGSSGLCVDIKSDPQNCGACGKSCPNANCTAGECDKVVFVTKISYGTNLGGVNGADGSCAAAASGAGLKGTFKAWISDGVAAPTNSFKKSNTPYVLSDGTTKVADSFAALGSGSLQHAINKAEDKTAVTGKTVMTNVKADGSVSAISFTCNGWGNTTGTDKFFGGSTDSSGVTWTDGSSATACTASSIYHLYCFEQ